MVMINKIIGEKMTTEGLCIRCAKELGIKPFSEYIEKMGIDDEQLDLIESQMSDVFANDDLDDAMGAAPAFDLSGLFQNSAIVPVSSEDNNGSPKNDTAAKEKKKNRKMLDTYCIDLTQKAKDGKIDKIVGRSKEVDRVVQILCRRQKNNPCLIGEPGVGKTAIAEALAQRIADKVLPQKLLNKEVFIVDMTALVAGTHFRGQFEGRVKSLVDEVKKEGNIILVIDEIHTIVQAGDSEGGMSAANILKPALSRGEIQVIGATTLSEYRKNIEKDQALERRFQTVIVNEPNIDDTVEILRGIKENYERFHGLRIPDTILYKATTLSERYITDRFLPDKAIDLLDEACARLALSSPIINEVDALKERIDSLRSKKEELEALPEPNDEIYAQIADLKVNELRLLSEFSEKSLERDNVELTENDLALVIEAWTEIPAANITENEFQKISELSDNLKKRIIGQDKAVDAVCRAIKRSRAGVAYKKKPVSFIFAGSTGVGKTELVKQLADQLFNSVESLIRLDMSEFMEKHSVSRIIGAPPGYVGYDDAGQLTEKIRRKPYSVILFDEIEKAHHDVLNILLQILDDGRITDAHGKTVNFENTVIIMTTNAGSDVKGNLTGFAHSVSFGDEEKTQKSLQEFLRPEFINRVDEIITFNRLNKDDFAKIAEIQLIDLKKALFEKGVDVIYNEDVCRFIANESYSEKYGARNLKRFIQKNVEDEIASKIISSFDKKITSVKLCVCDNKLEVELQ